MQIMRILFVIPGYYGHVNPTYALVKSLIESGNIVSYAVTSHVFKADIETMGATYIEIPKFLNEDLQEDKKNEETALSEEKFLSSLSDEEYTKLYIQTCDKYYDSDAREADYFFSVINPNQYDLVIGDKLYNLGMLLAKTYKIPFIQSDYHIFNTHGSEYDIMRLAGLPLEYKHIINTDCYEKFNSYLYKCCSVPIGAILPVDDYIKSYAEPQNYVIFYTPKMLFESNKAIHDDRNYLFLGNRFNSNIVSERFIKDELYPNDNIYISLGTIMNLRFSLFKTTLEVLGKSTYNITVSCGGANEVFEELISRNIYSNIHIFLFLDQRKILLESDIFITHGGANSIYESLYYSVPMILMPNGGDQIENSKMVESLKVGKVILYSETNFQGNLENALQDIRDNYHLYKQNTATIRGWLLESSKSSEIVSQIEGLLISKRDSLLVGVKDDVSRNFITSESESCNYENALLNDNLCYLDSGVAT